MSDAGSQNDGLFDDVLPTPEGGWPQATDPSTVWDQTYPNWRTGPALPIDPSAEPMPTDRAWSAGRDVPISSAGDFYRMAGLGASADANSNANIPLAAPPNQFTPMAPTSGGAAPANAAVSVNDLHPDKTGVVSGQTVTGSGTGPASIPASPPPTLNPGNPGAGAGQGANDDAPPTPVDDPTLKTCPPVSARILQGKTSTIGKRGAFSGAPGHEIPVEAGTAAIIPGEFGMTKSQLRPYLGQISGTMNGQPLFSGVTDVIDNKPPPPGTPPGMNARQGFEYLNPGSIILEVSGSPKDLGVHPVTLTVPKDINCPTPREGH